MEPLPQYTAPGDHYLLVAVGTQNTNINHAWPGQWGAQETGDDLGNGRVLGLRNEGLLSEEESLGFGG